MKVRKHLRDGISPERPKTYIWSYKLAPFGKAGVEHRKNLRWRFTRKARNVHFGLQLAPFCGAGVEYKKHLCGGISPERPEMKILSYKLELFCGCIV